MKSIINEQHHNSTVEAAKAKAAPAGSAELEPSIHRRKLGNNRGQRRLWLEGAILSEAGWQVGDKFDVSFSSPAPSMISGKAPAGGFIRYVKNPDGKRKVAGTAARPIIDTNSAKIVKALGAGAAAQGATVLLSVEASVIHVILESF